MKDLQIFQSSEFGELSVMMIDGREHFPATACAKLLGYTNPQEAIRTHCKGVRKSLTPSAGGMQQINLIPEGDLYRLIARSRLPAAERFERWVFDEVVPTIRKQGSYAPDIGEIIRQTVQVTLEETIRQIIPVVMQTAQIGELPPEAPPKRRRLRKSMSIIGKLDTELRQEIEDMILDGRHTYCDISEFFKQNYGIQVSRSAIGRHTAKLFQAEEELL